MTLTTLCVHDRIPLLQMTNTSRKPGGVGLFNEKWFILNPFWIELISDQIRQSYRPSCQGSHPSLPCLQHLLLRRTEGRWLHRIYNKAFLRQGTLHRESAIVRCDVGPDSPPQCLAVCMSVKPISLVNAIYSLYHAFTNVLSFLYNFDFLIVIRSSICVNYP